ncbi:MAG: elongation factor G [Candidatus Zixiibacteriota bacterium]|nr:MAG: elongation factor G [candidate division Zixibacteria bacterium]
MKEYSTDKIRNFCLAGQRGCGKTSLADAIAFSGGVNNRVGRVDDGSSLLDYTDAEISRKTTIASKLLAFEWKGGKVNIFDCPGHSDFVGELLSSAYVSDSVGFLVDAVAGVEIGTQLQWQLMGDSAPARFFVVNKMDKENANWQNCLDSIASAFGKSAVPLQIPIGSAESFGGLVDLLGQKAYNFDDKGNPSEVGIPAELKDAVEAAREKLIEAAAESDDALMEKYFDEGTLSPQDVAKGIKSGVGSGSIRPIFAASAVKNIGVKALLDFAAEYLPSGNEIAAHQVTKSGTEDQVDLPCDPSGKPVAYAFKVVSEGHLGEMTFFKVLSGTVKSGSELSNQQTGAAERVTQIYTSQGKNRVELASVQAGDIGVVVKLKDTHTGDTLSDKSLAVTVSRAAFPNPVMDVAIKPKSKGDEDKMAAALSKLGEEDPTFRFISDPALRQQVLWAQGSTHIDTIVEKLKARFGVDVDLTKPKIPYRETIRSKTETQYTHKKQSGGRGQYGQVHIRIEPNERGGGFEFVDEIKGGVIPSKYIPAVQKGILEAMVNGGLAGAPVVDVKVALFYGKQHEVDSSDMAFKLAGLMAFRQGFMECKPVLLEPVYNVDVLVPNDYTGDVMGDLSSRRAKIGGMDPEGPNQRIRAVVPQAELYQYSLDLRSMTQGQGVYSAELSHYEEVPHDTAQKVIAEAKAAREAESA